LYTLSSVFNIVYSKVGKREIRHVYQGCIPFSFKYISVVTLDTVQTFGFDDI